MRKITKTKFLAYYEQGILTDILVLPTHILARKTAHGTGETQSIEVVYVELP